MDRLRNLLLWLMLPGGIWGVIAGVDLQTDPPLTEPRHPAQCRGCLLGTRPHAANVALELQADP